MQLARESITERVFPDGKQKTKNSQPFCLVETKIRELSSSRAVDRPKYLFVEGCK